MKNFPPTNLAMWGGWQRAPRALNETPVHPVCECGCAFEAHISMLHVMIPCLTCRPCKEWRPVAA